MNWEIGIDMYTLMCIKWMTNKNLLYIKKSVTYNIPNENSVLKFCLSCFMIDYSDSGLSSCFLN